VRAGARTLVEGLDTGFAAGEFVAILGCNGSGKTLTLRTLAALRAPDGGQVELDGHDLRAQSRRSLAQRIGLLAQDAESGFVTTVEEFVLVGRHPHLGTFAWESETDRQFARQALASVGLAGFGARTTDRLSGGELRRVAIAALLAQQPEIFLLDEPTNHLDPQHQISVLEIFRACASAGATVIATLHDPNLAARYADRALLLFGDGRWRAGPSAEMLSASVLSELYVAPMIAGEIGGRQVVLPA